MHFKLPKIKYLMKGLFLSFMLTQLNACGINASADPAITTVDVTEIITGDTPTGVTVMTRKAEVFNDQASFSAELYQYAQFFAPVEVDFNTNQVLLVTLQQFTNGGYEIKVTQAEEYKNYVAVTIDITYPGEGCITTASLSAPYQFVTLNSIKPVIFSEQFTETVC